MTFFGKCNQLHLQSNIPNTRPISFVQRLLFHRDKLKQSRRCSSFAGSCTFDEGFSQCDYQQDPYDDFDWTHINTQEVPYVSPDLPQGEIPFLPSLLSTSHCETKSLVSEAKVHCVCAVEDSLLLIVSLQTPFVSLCNKNTGLFSSFWRDVMSLCKVRLSSPLLFAL